MGIVDLGANAAIAGSVIGSLRGQREDLAAARRRGLQLAKSGQFATVDEALAYSAAHGGDIHKQYAGQTAMDWLKTAAALGALVATGRPLLAVGGGTQFVDWQREKGARGEAFREAFEKNLSGGIQ